MFLKLGSFFLGEFLATEGTLSFFRESVFERATAPAELEGAADDETRRERRFWGRLTAEIGRASIS
jgi:hypothetical protein